MSFFLGMLPHGADWIYIGLIFVLLFGAKKIPELMGGLGKGLKEFKKAKQEFENEIHSSIKEEPKISTPAPAPLPPVSITASPAPLPGTVAKNYLPNGDSSKNN